MHDRSSPAQSVPRPLAILVAPVLFAALALPSADAAWAGVINANQHRIEVENCNPNNAPYPPFWELAQDTRISLSAYHLRPGTPGLFETARCLRNVQKPRIYDDDAGFRNLTEPKLFIGAICDAVRNDPSVIGREHYEHWAWSLTDLALDGLPVGGFNTWPGPAQQMALWISDPTKGCATTLAPNGTLDVSPPSGGDQRVVRWNSSPVTLIGFGHMGALAAGDRTVLVGDATNNGYLGSIRKYKSNLVRIWAIEQWSGKGVCQTANPDMEGITPFAGSYPDYELSIDGLNSAFFTRLREFVQLAADRGIVTQLSLFDRAGLINPSCPGGWFHSPYNMLANDTDPPFLDGRSMLPCGCDTSCTLDEPFFWEESPTACTTFDGILNDSDIQPIHNAYLRRMAQEIGGAGSVIFEIINEMNKYTHWTSIGEEWQGDYVACKLSKELPTFTTRDAFNAEAANQGLNAKAPDAGTGTWTASNALVERSQDPETLIQMGRVRGRPDATVSFMRGALSIPSNPNRHELGVRANVGFTGNSNMSLGFSDISNPASPSSNLVRVEVGATMLMVACKRVAVVKKTGGTIQELATTCVAVPEGADVHLLVDLQSSTAKVLVDGNIVLEGVALGALSSPLNFAYFHGWKASGFYRDTDGFVDNFEANSYYRDPSISCPFPN